MASPISNQSLIFFFFLPKAKHFLSSHVQVHTCSFVLKDSGTKIFDSFLACIILISHIGWFDFEHNVE